MTQPAFIDRDRTAVDALVADRYLDALLAAADRRSDDTPADAALDPDLRAAARALRRSLVRVHPSFRFEERLAARLIDLAATGTADPRPMTGTLLPFARRGDAHDLPDPLLGAILAGDIDPAASDGSEPPAPTPQPGGAPAPRIAALRRPWLVGGAITSAAISIAGVAYVAWRAGRSSRAESPALAQGATAGPG